MEQQNYDAEIEIDLKEIFYLLLRKIKSIVFVTLLGGIIALAVTQFLMTPMYLSSSTIYILTKTTSITSLTDLQMGSQLAQDFEILATSRPVVESVISDLALDTDYETLLNTITVENVSDSRMLRISVENPDATLAANISNALADTLRTRIAEIMVTDKPTKVEDAVVAQDPISPSKAKNTVIGAILGGMLICGFIVVKYLLDDTIKSADDIERHLKLNTLAEIPINPNAVVIGDTKKKGKTKSKNKRKKR